MEGYTYKYDAFISYRHQDKKIAKKLQRMLEGDIIPAKSGMKKKRLCICRDESEFSAGSSLFEEIYVKLRESKFLIVICEKEIKESPYCMEEIRYFKEIHNGRLDRVLILLMEGVSAEVLPEELTYEMREVCKPDGSVCLERHTVQPLYCDIRAENDKERMRLLKKEFLKLAAPLLGCGYDELFQRHLRYKMKKKVAGISICMAVISIICVLSYTAWISRRSQALIYEYTAKDCIEDGEWSQALLYYGKALELEPKRISSRIGAMILLQQHTWPYQEAEEQYMGICGNNIYPIFFPGEDITSSDHNCVSITPSGDYMLWRGFNGHYTVTNGEGEPLYTLDGKGESRYDETASGWVFYDFARKAFTFHWPEQRQEYELRWQRECDSSLGRPSACILAGNQVAVNDNQNLYIYELGSGGNKETKCIVLDNIFGKRPAVNGEEEWEQVERQEMWSSPDGGILAVSEVVVHGGNRDVSVSSKTALFDTKGMELLTVISNDEYALEKVVFSEHGEYVSLLYNNNISNFVTPGGLASVYTKDGQEVMTTEEGYSFIPRDAVFCDGSFLVLDYTTIHFWDIDSAEEYAVPITTPEAVQGVLKTEDGRYAVEWNLGVHYYNLASFMEEEPSAPLHDDMAAGANTPLDEPYLLMDGLYAFQRDERTVVLSDEQGNPYDVFSFQEENMQAIASVFYIPSVETLFVMDDRDELYGIPVLADKKQFIDVDDAVIASYVGSVIGAKDGVLVWCYLTNAVRYYARDIFDRFPHYLNWEARQENTGNFMGMCDNDKYAVFVVQDEKNDRYIAEIRDMKTGKYINELTLDDESPIDVMFFAEDGALSYQHGGAWACLKIDAPLPDRKAVRQIINLSGYSLDDNQVVISSGAIVNPDNFGNWTSVLR